MILLIAFSTHKSYAAANQRLQVANDIVRLRQYVQLRRENAGFSSRNSWWINSAIGGTVFKAIGKDL